LQTKIRVGAVSYLNTKPLIYGFEKGLMEDKVRLEIDFPSKISSNLLNNTIDVGLVPVVAIPQLHEAHVISDYCISCDGPVASVCLFSDVPIDSIQKILLDYQSRTSVELLKILIREFWKINPRLIETSHEYQSEISGSTAALMIGDRALNQRRISPYIYDLGEEWKKYTGLPFVFAAWVSNKKLDDDFINLFNQSNQFGLSHLDKVIEEYKNEIFDLKEYYTKFIQFELNSSKHKALQSFLANLSTGQVVR
jgi:chorismate dehydratase